MLGEIFIDDATEGMGIFWNSLPLSVEMFCTLQIHSTIMYTPEKSYILSGSVMNKK